MSDVLKKAAEILVECGYATECSWNGKTIDNEEWDEWQDTTPLADTLEGRRQADAIEDWLVSYKGYWKSGKTLWEESFKTHIRTNCPSWRHQWRLDRIKWCLEQLTGE